VIATIWLGVFTLCPHLNRIQTALARYNQGRIGVGKLSNSSGDPVEVLSSGNDLTATFAEKKFLFYFIAVSFLINEAEIVIKGVPDTLFGRTIGHALPAVNAHILQVNYVPDAFLKIILKGTRLGRTNFDACTASNAFILLENNNSAEPWRRQAYLFGKLGGIGLKKANASPRQAP